MGGFAVTEYKINAGPPPLEIPTFSVVYLPGVIVLLDGCVLAVKIGEFPPSSDKCVKTNPIRDICVTCGSNTGGGEQIASGHSKDAAKPSSDFFFFAIRVTPKMKEQWLGLSASFSIAINYDLHFPARMCCCFFLFCSVLIKQENKVGKKKPWNRKKAGNLVPPPLLLLFSLCHLLNTYIIYGMLGISGWFSLALL